jgi:hypothetical protein
METERTRFSLLFFAFLVMLAVAMAFYMLAVIPVGDLTILPHALGHSAELWCAERIQAYMSGKCKPQVCQCQTRSYYLCPDPRHGARWLGLVVTGDGKVITGFTARREYWQKKIKNCLCMR